MLTPDSSNLNVSPSQQNCDYPLDLHAHPVQQDLKCHKDLHANSMHQDFSSSHVTPIQQCHENPLDLHVYSVQQTPENNLSPHANLSQLDHSHHRFRKFQGQLYDVDSDYDTGHGQMCCDSCLLIPDDQSKTLTIYPNDCQKQNQSNYSLGLPGFRNLSTPDITFSFAPLVNASTQTRLSLGEYRNLERTNEMLWNQIKILSDKKEAPSTSESYIMWMKASDQRFRNFIGFTLAQFQVLQTLLLLEMNNLVYWNSKTRSKSIGMSPEC